MISRLKELLGKAAVEAEKAVNEAAETITQAAGTISEAAAPVAEAAENAIRNVAGTRYEDNPAQAANNAGADNNGQCVQNNNAGGTHNELVSKLASVILANFQGCAVETEVSARTFDESAHAKAKSVSVLVSKDGNPVLAIAVVRMNTYKSMPVVGTKKIIENKGIPYLRFFEECTNDDKYIVDRLGSYLA